MVISKDPVNPVMLRQAYPGSSVYTILSSGDHNDWNRAAEILLTLTRQLVVARDLWCGLIVAGCGMSAGQPSTSEKDWHYFDGIQFLAPFTPHETEHPRVFRRVDRATRVAIACTNLPHVLHYNVYLWIKSETYGDLIQELVSEVQRHNITVVH